MMTCHCPSNVKHRYKNWIELVKCSIYLIQNADSYHVNNNILKTNNKSIVILLTREKNNYKLFSIMTHNVVHQNNTK